jgi:cytoskeletal protein RodZ
VSLTYEGTDGMESETIREVRTKRFFVWSWAAIAVIAAIVLALGLRWWRRRRARQVEAGPSDPLTSPGGARATPASAATEPAPVEPATDAPRGAATASEDIEPEAEPAPRQPDPVGADSGPWRS